MAAREELLGNIQEVGGFQLYMSVLFWSFWIIIFSSTNIWIGDFFQYKCLIIFFPVQIFE